MTALRFQTGGDIRHPRPPFGENKGQKQGYGSIYPVIQIIKLKKNKKIKIKTLPPALTTNVTIREHRQKHRYQSR